MSSSVFQPFILCIWQTIAELTVFGLVSCTVIVHNGSNWIHVHNGSNLLFEPTSWIMLYSYKFPHNYSKYHTNDNGEKSTVRSEEFSATALPRYESILLSRVKIGVLNTWFTDYSFGAYRGRVTVLQKYCPFCLLDWVLTRLCFANKKQFSSKRVLNTTKRTLLRITSCHIWNSYLESVNWLLYQIRICCILGY